MTKTKETKELVWRLPEKLTGRDVSQMVTDEVITKEEARQLLFTEREKIKQSEFKEVKQELELIRNILQNMVTPKDVIQIPGTHPMDVPMWASWFTRP